MAFPKSVNEKFSSITFKLINVLIEFINYSLETGVKNVLLHCKWFGVSENDYKDIS